MHAQKMVCNKQRKRLISKEISRFCWPEWRDSFAFSSRREENGGVAAVEPSASDCPPDSRISSFKSRFIQTEKSRLRRSGFWTFGPSGETRTRGILVPKTLGNFFLTFSAPFVGVCSGIRCFPQLFSPLFPGVRIRSMVKNVVKSKCSPKGSTFRGAFSRSEVW